MSIIHRVKLLVAFSALLIFAGCSAPKQVKKDRPCHPLTQQAFLDQPFYIPMKMAHFEDAYGSKFRLRKFLRDVPHVKTRKDTIYRFHHGPTSMLFYLTPEQDTTFLTSKIADPSIELRPCIRVGLSRKRLEGLIQHFPSNTLDTVTIANDKRQAVFIFKERRLQTIYINNYFK